MRRLRPLEALGLAIPLSAATTHLFQNCVELVAGIPFGVPASHAMQGGHADAEMVGQSLHSSEFLFVYERLEKRPAVIRKGARAFEVGTAFSLEFVIRELILNEADIRGDASASKG